MRAADRLIANTSEEPNELARHYEAEPGKVAVVHPGVNLDRFRPADGRAAARARLGLPQDALIPLFAGRIQPLKAPDVLLRAVAVLLDERPELRGNIVVPVVGGPSGTGLAKPEGLQKLAARLGIADVVLFRPPVDQEQLADWFRAASVLVMPSYSESFGLVAIEAQAAGTPVLAAEVGGLPVAVCHQETGFLIPGHDPVAYARVLRDFADDQALSARMGEAAARHAQRFGWDTAAATADVYTAAEHDCRRKVRAHQGYARTAQARSAGRLTHAPSMADAASIIEQVLTEAELEWESPKAGSYVVKLPGTRKLSTTVSLIVVGKHSSCR